MEALHSKDGTDGRVVKDGNVKGRKHKDTIGYLGLEVSVRLGRDNRGDS